MRSGKVWAGILFLGFLLFLLLPKNDFDPLERKALAAPPALDAASLLSGDAFRRADDYINDHFPLRATFVAASSYLKLPLGMLCQNGIYPARGGYLLQEPAAMTGPEITRNLNQIEAFAAKSGLAPLYLPVPEPGWALSEEIYGPHPPYCDDLLYEKIDPGACVDLRDRFYGQKGVYYKTDHHWTTPGAYQAYTAYCDKAGFSPLPKAAFEKAVIPGFRGTTCAKSGLYGVSAEEIEIWQNGVPCAVSVVEPAGAAAALFDWSQAESADPYAVFLGGNFGLMKIQTENKSGRRLLLLKDSYANSFVPFLTAHFEEIWLVDLRYYRTGALSALAEERAITDLLVLYGAGTLAATTDFTFLK